MKKVSVSILAIISYTLIFSQSPKLTPAFTAKIILTTGQKITVESNVTIEANLSMGMELSSNSVSENYLEVKNSTDKNYTISNTLTKLKVDMNMMGQSTNYDSEKKAENNSDIAKTFDEKLNNPVDIIIDNTTGMAIPDDKKENKKGEDQENQMQGLLNMFAESTDNAVVSAAFELIPFGKKVGDIWSDSTVAKDIKTINTYTLKSVTNNEAVIQLDAFSTAVSKLDMQDMEIEFKSNSKTSGEITTDISSGKVKKRVAKADITGSFQLMGQDVPITANASSTSIYK
jgi:hypothetical protein